MRGQYPAKNWGQFGRNLQIGYRVMTFLINYGSVISALSNT